MRTNQRQQHFMDAVSHELHTPLASLRLYLDTLRKPGLDPERAAEFLAIMQADLERLQSTIGRVLDAATSQERPGRREVVALRPLLEQCATEVCAAERVDPARLRNRVGPGTSVRGDPELLRVALRNLLENAVRHGGEDPRVEIHARPVSSRRLELVVEDHGPGLPAFALRQIFQRFQRLPADAARPTRGLGLGLYIVRNVARASRGSVRAESDGPGRGSRFILTLPGQIDGDARPTG
jgi:signal transduction histidine kinase